MPIQVRQIGLTTASEPDQEDASTAQAFLRATICGAHCVTISGDRVRLVAGVTPSMKEEAPNAVSRHESWISRKPKRFLPALDFGIPAEASVRAEKKSQASSNAMLDQASGQSRPPCSRLAHPSRPLEFARRCCRSHGGEPHHQPITAGAKHWPASGRSWPEAMALHHTYESVTSPTPVACGR